MAHRAKNVRLVSDLLNAFIVIANVNTYTIVGQSYAYFRGDTALNWIDAQSFCNNYGTNLASIHSKSQFNETLALCQGYYRCWIGLNDRDKEGTYIWDDGSNTDYGFTNDSAQQPTTDIYPWIANNPDNWNNNEDCVQLWMIMNYAWNDEDCEYQHIPICNAPESISLV